MPPASMRHWPLSDRAAPSIRPQSRSRRASAAPRSSASATTSVGSGADRHGHRQVARGRCRDRCRVPAGARSPDDRRCTALAIRVAAASAAAAVAASTVARSAMPSEKERPPRPEVAMPRTGRSWVQARRRRRARRSAKMPARSSWPGVQMDGDVAAVVDVGLVERCGRAPAPAASRRPRAPATAAIGVM